MADSESGESRTSTASAIFFSRARKLVKLLALIALLGLQIYGAIKISNQQQHSIGTTGSGGVNVTELIHLLEVTELDGLFKRR